MQLDVYAELGVRFGVNVQPGQLLVIRGGLETAPLIRRMVKKGYELGARQVIVEWDDKEVMKTRLQYSILENLEEVLAWKVRGYEEMAEDGAAFLYVNDPNPGFMDGIEPERIHTLMRASQAAQKKFTDFRLKNNVRWTGMAYATKAWATKVFPEMTQDEALEKLWEAIFYVTRANLEDPTQAWEEHIDNLHRRSTYLNAMRFRRLYYRAPGTDLSVELPESHTWVSARMNAVDGIPFVANIPTEEVFTLPKKEGVNGVVTSTKPLNVGGQIVPKFTLTLRDGRIVDVQAETGLEAMQKLIETDEGSHYLGEIALVPHASPISNLNLIFQDTLFDENASCHIAIGMALAFCIEGGTTMSRENLEQAGANMSLTHNDFMVGSEEMDIDGETADGVRIPLFRAGNWAI